MKIAGLNHLSAGIQQEINRIIALYDNVEFVWFKYQTQDCKLHLYIGIVEGLQKTTLDYVLPPVCKLPIPSWVYVPYTEDYEPESRWVLETEANELMESFSISR